MLRQTLAAYRWLVDPAGGGAAPADVVVGGDSAGGHLALGLVHALRREEAERGEERRGERGGEAQAGQPAGVVLMSPWLDPGRDHPRTAEAWRNAGASVDYLRGVEHSLEFVSDAVFGGRNGGGGGDAGEEEESSSSLGTGLPPPPPRNLLQKQLWERAAGEAAGAGATGAGGIGALPPVLVQFGGAEVLAGEARAFGEMAAEAAGEWDVTLEEWDDMPHVFQVFDSIAPEGGAAIKSAAAFVARVTG
jgi:acetyl esterase/lipase